jgi:hypothetical protein
MLENFFKLNAADSAERIDTQEEFLEKITQSKEITNVIFLPHELRPPRPKNVVKDKILRNISFRSTRFYDVEFRNCAFEDCLFVGSEFERCEIHSCTFKGCNFHKVRLLDTYVNPRVFIGLFDPVKHANIGVHVFQQLRANALNTHQPVFFETADWHFRRWLRYEMIDKHRRDKEPLARTSWRVFRNWAYEVFLGYGHSLQRFVGWSLAAFVVIVSFNCWWFRSGMHVPNDLETIDGTARTIYYTLVTLTTLGYGDITPATQGGMIVAGLEALLGLIWFGMLTSIIVKKVFR